MNNSIVFQIARVVQKSHKTYILENAVKKDLKNTLKQRPKQSQNNQILMITLQFTRPSKISTFCPQKYDSSRYLKKISKYKIYTL